MESHVPSSATVILNWGKLEQHHDVACATNESKHIGSSVAVCTSKPKKQAVSLPKSQTLCSLSAIKCHVGMQEQLAIDSALESLEGR